MTIRPRNEPDDMGVGGYGKRDADSEEDKTDGSVRLR